ncbi:MAG: TolC family protein [Dehalococcoidia bacterium]|jgi:outer membrane protein TolC|nr:TolC family protein [Dehalococcoidia bacterium]
MTIVSWCVVALTIASGTLLASPVQDEAPPGSDDGAPRGTYSANGDPRLGTLIEVALARNTEILGSTADYRAAQTRVAQVGTFPDPVVGITQSLWSPETRVGPVGTVLSFSQQVPWFGKRDDDEAIVASEAEAARYVHGAAEAEVVRRLKVAYYDLAFLDRAIDITEEDRELLGHYETLAQARYAQGVGLQQAVLKLQAELTRSIDRLATLRQRRSDAAAILNTLLDRPPDLPVEPVASTVVLNAALFWERLYTMGRENRPEVNAALRRIDARETGVTAAERRYLPDVTFGAGVSLIGNRNDPAGIVNPPPDNGKNAITLSLGLSLPLFRDKYDASTAEAAERLVAARQRHRGAINQVEVEIRSHGTRLQTLRDQLALFTDLLLPQAQQTLASSEAAYSTGTIGVLDLLDSERVLFDVQVGLAQLRSDYMKTLADLERAVGTAFPEVTP